MAKKRRKYKTDTEAGIRTIRQIDALPSCELTDEELVKQFYHRFDATALVLAYCDNEGQRQIFGRLKYGKNPGYWYRQLLHVVDAHIPTILPRESIIEWLEKAIKEIDANEPHEAKITLLNVINCIREDMELHSMKFEDNG